MNECIFCHKDCKMEAFVPESGMTINFPVCNDVCLKKHRLERGYDAPKKKWEVDFKVSLLQKDRRDFIANINKEIKDLLSLKGDKHE